MFTTVPAQLLIRAVEIICIFTMISGRNFVLIAVSMDLVPVGSFMPPKILISAPWVTQTLPSLSIGYARDKQVQYFQASVPFGIAPIWVAHGPNSLLSNITVNQPGQQQ